LPKREPNSVADILKKLVKTTKLGEHMQHARIWEEWERLAGEDIAANTRPVGIRRGVLRVEATNPVWLHKAGLWRMRLQQRINRLAGDVIVTDVYLVHADDDTWWRRGERVSLRGLPR